MRKQTQIFKNKFSKKYFHLICKINFRKWKTRRWKPNVDVDTSDDSSLCLFFLLSREKKICCLFLFNITSKKECLVSLLNKQLVALSLTIVVGKHFYRLKKKTLQPIFCFRRNELLLQNGVLPGKIHKTGTTIAAVTYKVLRKKKFWFWNWK